MTPEDPAIVNPVRGKHSPAVGPSVILAGTQTDLKYLNGLCFSERVSSYPLYLGSIFQEPQRLPGVTVAGPVLGAPFAAMMLETLIVWGAKSVFFMGWCGSVSPDLAIGDVVVPDRALIDEGTSRHYPHPETNDFSATSGDVKERITRRLDAAGIAYHEGPVWTTDAIFRETRGAVERHQRNGVLAVEMEFSALCSISRFRAAAFGGALVVSDRLSEFTWQPGFKDPRFTNARKSLARQLLIAALP